MSVVAALSFLRAVGGIYEMRECVVFRPLIISVIGISGPDDLTVLFPGYLFGNGIVGRGGRRVSWILFSLPGCPAPSPSLVGRFQSDETSQPGQQLSKVIK